MGKVAEHDADDGEEEAQDPHHEEPGHHVREEMALPGVIPAHDPQRLAQLADRALGIPEREHAASVKCGSG